MPAPRAHALTLAAGPLVFLALAWLPIPSPPYAVRCGLGLLLWMGSWWLVRPVHLAVTGLLDNLPDMVVSGINLGANMGDDTIYSGTVAAATEGYLLGVPSLAVSLASKAGSHFDTAARVTLEMVERLRRAPISEPVLLNLNVPDLAYDALRGIEITRLGKRHKAEPVIKEVSPRKETVYWVGPAGGAQDAGEGTDFYAVAAQRVSVTPLQIDLTHVNQIPLLRDWLQR